VSSTEPGGGVRRSFLLPLTPYFRQLAGLLLLGSLGGVVMNTAIVLPPLLLGRAVNVVVAVEHHRAQPQQVGLAALLFVAGTAATELPRIGKRYWLGVARTRFRASVRLDALRGVLGWPPTRFAEIPVGDVMARIIGDVEVLGVGVGEIMVETWDTLLFSASLIAAMVWLDPTLAALSLAPVPLALLLAKRSEPMVMGRTTRARRTESDLTGFLREQLQGMRLLRLTGSTGAAAARMGGLAQVQANAELAAILLEEALATAYTVVLGSGVVFIVWLGGSGVVAGTLSLGGLVAFLALFGRFVTRAPRIPQMVNRVQAAAAAQRRLAPLLALPASLASSPRWSSFSATHVPQCEGQPAMTTNAPRGPASLRLASIRFTHPGSVAPAIRDFDLEVEAGVLVAVTGPVGCGKSTLAKLAAGLLAPDSGVVELDGQPLSGFDGTARSTSIGYLGQDPQLFSGTVAENVGLWLDAPMEEQRRLIFRALHLANLDRDLEQMPLGAATQIGESGVRVSGGQRQRIALARALAAGGGTVRLLVLDDPFSAVDVETEAAILTGLRRAFGPAAPPQERLTIMLCSHRLAAFPLADLVVVLEAGSLLELGSHQALLTNGGLYARIYGAQAAIRDQDQRGCGR